MIAYEELSQHVYRHSCATGGMRYWTEGSGDESTIKPLWWRPYYAPRSNDIEMTSYALLTYVRRNEVAMAAPIMKWIASKQNELGGYSSTQVIPRISGCVLNIFLSMLMFFSVIANYC